MTTSRTREDLYERFSRMDEAAAQTYLRRFLREGERGFRQVEEDLRRDGIDPDFSLASVVAVFEWLAGRIRVGEVEPSAGVPEFIVEASRAQGAYLELLDEESEALALLGAYYLGQSFVVQYPRLRWDIAPEDEMTRNQPVVTGFDEELSLPALEIARTLLRKSVLPGFGDSVATVVESRAALA